MHAFVEWLCEHSGIVRVGLEANKYGDPFDYAVAFVVDRTTRTATVKALVANKTVPLTIAHYRAVMGALKEERLDGIYERVKLSKGNQ